MDLLFNLFHFVLFFSSTYFSSILSSFNHIPLPLCSLLLLHCFLFHFVLFYSSTSSSSTLFSFTPPPPPLPLCFPLLLRLFLFVLFYWSTSSISSIFFLQLFLFHFYFPLQPLLSLLLHLFFFNLLLHLPLSLIFWPIMFLCLMISDQVAWPNRLTPTQPNQKTISSFIQTCGFRSECSSRTRFVWGSVCLSVCMSVTF